MERVAWVWLVVAAAVVQASAYTVVTKDGRKLQAEAPPTFHDGKARVVLSGGLAIEIAESDVDRGATARANEGAATPAAFTNEDLAKAKGLSDSGGEVSAEGKDKALGPSRSPSGRPSGRASRPSEAAPPLSPAEARVMELEKRVDELNREIKERCREWSFSNPTSDCDPKLQEELRDTVAQLNAAKGEREAERQATHEERLESFEGREGDEARARALPALEARVESLRKQLAEIEERLAEPNSTGADLNRKLQVAADLTRAEKELAAAQEE